MRKSPRQECCRPSSLTSSTLVTGFANVTLETSAVPLKLEFQVPGGGPAGGSGMAPPAPVTEKFEACDGPARQPSEATSSKTSEAWRMFAARSYSHGPIRGGRQAEIRVRRLR